MLIMLFTSLAYLTCPEHCKTLCKQLSSAGGRLVIASDGVWDALSAEISIECCRGMSPDAAASQIVKVRIRS